MGLGCGGRWTARAHFSIAFRELALDVERGERGRVLVGEIERDGQAWRQPYFLVVLGPHLYRHHICWTTRGATSRRLNPRVIPTVPGNLQFYIIRPYYKMIQ